MAEPVPAHGMAEVVPLAPVAPAAFTAFYRRELPRLVALAAAIAGHARAEDVAQEALLRAHRDWDRIAQYDKPGGKDSIQLPITVEPSTGLGDGDTVTVTASGFQPGEQVGIVQCAREAGGETPEARGGVDGCYLGEVQYGAPPAPPSFAVSPTDGLAPGDEITVQGEGFVPGAEVHISICAGPSGQAAMRFACSSSDSSLQRAEDDGTFAVRWQMPDLGEAFGHTTKACDGGPCSGEAIGQPMGDCHADGVECAIVVESYHTGSMDGMWPAPPQWQPEPVS